MAASVDLFVAAGIGAVAQEALHWYRRREQMRDKESRALMMSVPYWVITVIVIVLATITIPLYLVDGDSAAKMFLSGAAFPTLLKKLIDTPLENKPQDLGPAKPKAQILRSYLLGA